MDKAIEYADISAKSNPHDIPVGCVIVKDDKEDLKEHSFDLKDFMEKESSFYFDNISKFAPYAKISDVSDSIKITIKK